MPENNKLALDFLLKARERFGKGCTIVEIMTIVDCAILVLQEKDGKLKNANRKTT